MRVYHCPAQGERSRQLSDERHGERQNVLHELITAQHAEILARTRAKRMKRSGPKCVPIEPDEGIPRLLHQLSAALRLSRSTPGLMDEQAALRGALLLRT